MFAPGYFAPTYFAPQYWPPGLVAPAPVGEAGGAFWPFGERRKRAFREIEARIRQKREEAAELRAEIRALVDPKARTKAKAKPRKAKEKPDFTLPIRDNAEARRLAGVLQSVEAEIEVLAASLLRHVEEEDEEDAIALLLT